MIAKICVLRSKDLYSVTCRDFATDASYVDHFFLSVSPPSGGGYVSHTVGNIVAAAIKFGFLLLFLVALLSIA